MPKKWIDKNKATTYNLVHRAYDDPLYHDDEAAQAVYVKSENLNDKTAKQARKDKWISGSTLHAQQSDFAREGRRDNEGEAALYGITYDDSNYDYMKHLRPIGGNEDGIFISKSGKRELSGQAQEKLAVPKGAFVFKDEVDQAPTGAEAPVELPAEMLPSQEKVERSYQSQQNIPDALSGLQPDMDPRLREVLEALDDDAYVEEDDDIFSELVGTGEENDEGKWKRNVPKEEVVRKEDEADWEYEFRKFKLEDQPAVAEGGDASDVSSDFGSDFGSGGDRSEREDTLGDLPNIGEATKSGQMGRKKRIGAKTDLTGFSMSSSANYRNPGLSLLDDRFDKVEQEYAHESESEEEPEFDMKKERPDLENIMDDFLSNYVVEGKKLWKK